MSGSNFIDLTGQQFGRLTVLERGPNLESLVIKNRVRWWCLCSCGNKILVPRGSLKSGNTKSCGCLNRETIKECHVTPQTRTIIICWNKYRHGARRRGIKFGLTQDQVASIIFQNCHYCGREPEHERKVKNTIMHNGIDRKDSDKGYTKDNVVPCCGHCNFLKKTMDYETFYNMRNNPDIPIIW